MSTDTSIPASSAMCSPIALQSKDPAACNVGGNDDDDDDGDEHGYRLSISGQVRDTR